MAINFYPAAGLVGGNPEDLDYIDGNLLQNYDGALVITDGFGYIYTLNSTLGGSADPPNIIAPATNAGTKRWQLLHTFNLLEGATKHLIYANSPGAF